ncbi:class I SAM-dependent DNA methyltransferase [Thalassiella azotivora]
MTHQDTPANRWLAETGGTRGAQYAARFDALEASGADVHGEADFVDRLLEPGSRVVDGGCGTGRVGRELARRGHRVVGVDLDGSMLAEARRRAPDLTWHHADLLDVAAEDVDAPVDAVVLAGNVVVYLTPGTEQDVVAHLAGWLRPGGLLVAGFAADREVTPRRYRECCAAAGLTEVAAHAGWDGAPEDLTSGYVVLVHRR